MASYQGHGTASSVYTYTAPPLASRANFCRGDKKPSSLKRQAFTNMVLANPATQPPSFMLEHTQHVAPGHDRQQVTQLLLHLHLLRHPFIARSCLLPTKCPAPFPSASSPASRLPSLTAAACKAGRWMLKYGRRAESPKTT